MNWFTEDPTPIIVGGVIGLVLLLAAVVRTGRGALLYAAVAWIALIAGLVALERYVVTDLEKVEATIYGAADAVENNDAPRLASYLLPSETALRQEVLSRTRSIHMTDAKIGDLQVTFNPLTIPPSASAAVLGRIAGSRGSLAFNYLLRMEVVLVEHQGQWLVKRYELKSRD